MIRFNFFFKFFLFLLKKKQETFRWKKKNVAFGNCIYGFSVFRLKENQSWMRNQFFNVSTNWWNVIKYPITQTIRIQYLCCTFLWDFIAAQRLPYTTAINSFRYFFCCCSFFDFCNAFPQIFFFSFIFIHSMKTEQCMIKMIRKRRRNE